MKKLSFVAIMLLCGFTAFGQAIKDRNVIPVAVSLNQVLRMSITNGGAIEFVFNTIEDYKNGLSAEGLGLGTSMYQTDFAVSSSTRWALTYGSETASFIGTDNPTTNALDLNNVGYRLTESGAHSFGAAGALIGADATKELYSAITDNTGEVAALEVYPKVLITDNTTINANAGDDADNSFSLLWRCGTKELATAATVTDMAAVAIIDQKPSPAPDRYVTNVIFELAAL